MCHEGNRLNDNKIDNEVRSLISMRGALYKTIKEGKWYLPFITTRTQTGCATKFFCEILSLTFPEPVHIFVRKKQFFFGKKIPLEMEVAPR